MNLGNETRGYLLCGLAVGRVPALDFRPSQPARMNGSALMLRRAYKHGVCPCEVVKVMSERGDQTCSPGPRSLFIGETRYAN